MRTIAKHQVLLPEGITVPLVKVLAIVDSDEFYGILPGDGQDDFICNYLRKKLLEVVRLECQQAVVARRKESRRATPVSNAVAKFAQSTPAWS